jgi:hypothetical protein
MYYWSGYFGFPALLHNLMTTRWVVGATWLVIVVELFLAVAVLTPRRMQQVALIVGLSFHLLIALLLGLWSFSFAMSGALVLYLGRSIDFHHLKSRSVDSSAPTEEWLVAETIS